MSSKVPIYLKRGSRKGKREKLRDILSSDMISPPLGDFRHTIHIGSGGESDMFGDLSFLQGKFHLLPRTQGSLDSERGSQYETPFEFSRTATVCSHDQAVAEKPSPLLKNAISLPVIGGPQALMLPATQAPPKPPRLHLDDKVPLPLPIQPEEDMRGHQKVGETALSTILKTAGQEAQSFKVDEQLSSGSQNGFPTEENLNEPFLSHAGSLLSLHVDLGPSILDDVLWIMDKCEDNASRQDKLVT
ncbi:cdc42 effector protein 2 [Rhinatrema bivittatum]|uniref:cdc42 effector protein 2 n=1 Tax=Rhinatrema bivittatum TaxID=194408 RepID=UPI00112DC3DC|nr:cdc42 effector protein 2 [Rhinatrema bivittatum]XP_029467718.1 cdc42 effector protein 2 [Rhinatrema bivittatum]XP_029467719.1 cdc42 effector protein 2 [Rhinatrema bivittatum]XP_029467720.1 cdc42 effector protein 2 [Rhinatrema bivittatum]XP_029467721.1 cdc42 effector protein 2 [Rhinatrema bivittatum]XP_029467723.1 cdc42 effector protein 2 [Rhinatrema bivittatum]